MLIGELAKTAGITKDSIRHYMDVGLLKPAARRAGHRTYNDFSQQDIERLKWVSLGKSLGFTLSEIKPYLDMFMSNTLPKEQAVGMFRDKLEEVNLKIAELENIKRILESKLAGRN